MKQSSIPLSTGRGTTNATSTKTPPSDLQSIINMYTKASNQASTKTKAPVKQPKGKQRYCGHHVKNK